MTIDYCTATHLFTKSVSWRLSYIHYRRFWVHGVRKEVYSLLQKCSCSRNCGRGRIMLELIKKTIRNWLGHWLWRNCLLKDALEGMVNGKKVRGRRRYQIIDNTMINGLYADTKRKAEKKVEWRKLSLQCTWKILKFAYKMDKQNK